jgi:hypothetical protein
MRRAVSTVVNAVNNAYDSAKSAYNRVVSLPPKIAEDIVRDIEDTGMDVGEDLVNGIPGVQQISDLLSSIFVQTAKNRQARGGYVHPKDFAGRVTRAYKRHITKKKLFFLMNDSGDYSFRPATLFEGKLGVLHEGKCYTQSTSENFLVRMRTDDTKRSVLQQVQSLFLDIEGKLPELNPGFDTFAKDIQEHYAAIDKYIPQLVHACPEYAPLVMSTMPGTFLTSQPKRPLTTLGHSDVKLPHFANDDISTFSIQSMGMSEPTLSGNGDNITISGSALLLDGKQFAGRTAYDPVYTYKGHCNPGHSSVFGVRCQQLSMAFSFYHVQQVSIQYIPGVLSASTDIGNIVFGTSDRVTEVVPTDLNQFAIMPDFSLTSVHKPHTWKLGTRTAKGWDHINAGGVSDPITADTLTFFIGSDGLTGNTDTGYFVIHYVIHLAVPRPVAIPLPPMLQCRYAGSPVTYTVATSTPILYNSVNFNTIPDDTLTLNTSTGVFTTFQNSYSCAGEVGLKLTNSTPQLNYCAGTVNLVVDGVAVPSQRQDFAGSFDDSIALTGGAPTLSFTVPYDFIITPPSTDPIATYTFSINVTIYSGAASGTVTTALVQNASNVVILPLFIQ